jgi:hypothetical protein
VSARRPRHTITQADEVDRAPAPLRESAARDEERRRRLREAFIDHGHEHFDADAARAVRERAWTHE